MMGGWALIWDGYFFMKKGALRSQIPWLFLIHYELSEYKFFFIFHSVFLVDVEGAGATQKQPAIRVNVYYPSYLLQVTKI